MPPCLVHAATYIYNSSFAVWHVVAMFLDGEVLECTVGCGEETNMACLRFSISGAYYTLFLHPHVESNLYRVAQDMSQYPHAHTWSFVASLREDSSPRWLSAVTSKLPVSGALPVQKLLSVIQAGLMTVPPPDILRTEADRVDDDIPDGTIADEDTQSVHTESSAATCVNSPFLKRRRTIDWLVLQRYAPAVRFLLM